MKVRCFGTLNLGFRCPVSGLVIFRKVLFAFYVLFVVIGVLTGGMMVEKRQIIRLLIVQKFRADH